MIAFTFFSWRRPFSAALKIPSQLRFAALAIAMSLAAPIADAAHNPGPPMALDKPVVLYDGRNMANYLNGVKVLELTDASLDHGRLLFQSEGAEIFYRRIELHPLKSDEIR